MNLAGIKINGNNLWNIQVYIEEFCRRSITKGELGLSETYMNS